jgi:hypothetical protein
MLFGYHLEADFDIAIEQRRDRLTHALIGLLIVCVLYLFSGEPYATEVFQGCIATGLFYGENFYVRRRDDLGQVWLRKVILATIPLHVLYLAAFFWSDKTFPSVMTKSIAFMPILALGFAIESILVDGIITRLKPASPDQEATRVTQT